MATLLEDPRRLGARAQLPAPPQFQLGATPPSTALVEAAPPAPSSELIGRRPTINMGPVEVVQPARVATAAAPAALAAPGAAAAGFPVARAVGGAGAALGVGLEGKQVYDVATNPNSTGIDVATQAAQGVSRLSAAGAGAAGGAAAGSALGPVGAAVGGILGGGAGYFAADRAIAGGRQLVGADPRSPAEQVAAAAPPPATAPGAAAPTPPEGGGAVLGFFPQLGRNQFRSNTMDAQLRRGWQSTAPGVFAPAQPAVAPPPLTPRLNNLTDPRSLEFQGGAVPVGPVAPPPTDAAGFGAVPPAAAAPVQDPNLPLGVTRTGNTYSDGSPSSGVGVVGAAGVTSADRLAQLNRDIAFQQDKQTWRNPNDPTPGLAVFNTAIDPNRNADFNAQANLNTLSSRGPAPGRNGAAAFQQQVDAIQTPLQQRAAAAALATKEAGETQRTLIQERAAEARTRAQTTQQQEANAIDRARLGIEAIRAGNAGVPAGYRVKTDGTGLEPIPGGPADPNTPKGKNALNDTQAKALQFGSRMQASESILDKLAASGVNQPGLIKRGADAVGLGSAANWTQSPEQQQVEQAQRDFINAALRRESGAAIADSEFANARQQYFPQPGDSAQVIAQKKMNRELATRGILAEVPDGEKRLAQVAAPAATPAASLPPGMTRQVGTSGGKPVYEDANGRRFF